MDFYFRDFQDAFKVFYVLLILEIDFSIQVRYLGSSEYEIIITIKDGYDCEH